MTKHEMLDYIDEVTSVTILDMSNIFGGTYVNAAILLKRMKRQGLIEDYGSLKNNKVGRNKILYSLTEKGLERLNHFDETSCPNKKCSCKKRGN